MASRITKRKKLSYSKWGYLFILPFFIVFAIFQLYPLIRTFIYAFEGVQEGFTVTKGFTFSNIASLFIKEKNGQLFWKAFGVTMITWIIGFVPQILVSLLLAVWFTDNRLKIKGAGFFKAVIYMPNLIMATAMASLVGSMFQNDGPLGMQFKFTSPAGFPILIFGKKWGVKILIAFINFLMWFGNTTILLMAGVMGIDDSIFEAATIDGAGPFKTFFDITFPLLLPIFLYVFLTSLIGGIQMFDIPQNITRSAQANSDIRTVIMYLNMFLGTSENYYMAGAVSVLLFIITGALSVVVYFMTTTDMSEAKKKRKAKKKVTA